MTGLQMTAAVYHGDGRITLERLPRPHAGPGEIVVLMRACGLCGSDIMRWYQDPRAPVVLGHEPVGVVVEAGDGAGFAVGERVFVHHHVPCGVCDLCRRGRDTLCATFRATRIDPGGLAEYVRVPAENVAADVLRIPDALGDVAATLIEPVACIVRGQRTAGVGTGSRVAVVGAGSMGLIQVMVALARGAESVAVVEPDPARAELARRAGATLAPGLDAAAVRAVLGPDGADQVLVCTHADAAVAGALAMAGTAGVVQMFAVPQPGHVVGLDLGAVFFREVRLESTYSAGPADTREALELIAAGRIDDGLVVSHVMPLAAAQEAYDRVTAGQAVKVVVTMGEGDASSRTDRVRG